MLVYGDTNSTLAGALAARPGAGAGRPRRGRHALVRPRDARGAQPGRWPTTPATCCSARPRPRWRTWSARASPGEVHLVGDVMADVSLAFRPIAEERSHALAEHGLEPGGYLLATAHRAGNVDDPERLERLVVAARGAAAARASCRSHPRTAARLEAAGLRERLDAARQVLVLPPLGYLDFMQAGHARPRGPHRLRRRPEGGVPARGAVRDAARDHRVGRDRRRRLEHAGGPRSRRPRWPRWSARRRRASGPSSTAAGAPQSGLARCSPPTLLGDERTAGTDEGRR